MPKIGDVLFVKSTEEPVIFISERPQDADDTFPEHSGLRNVYVVRRPCPTQHGIQTYKFFDFLQEELDTADGVHKRNIQGLKRRQELMMAEIDLSGPISDQKPS